MKQFLTAALFTFIISIALGTLLAFYQSNERLNITIEAYDSVTKESIGNFEVNTLPVSNIMHNEDVAGEGRLILDIRHFWFARASVSAKGYKTQSQIFALLPNKIVPFYLESTDPSIYEHHTTKDKGKAIEKLKEEAVEKQKTFDMESFFNQLQK